jgi:threonine dehydratase
MDRELNLDDIKDAYERIRLHIKRTPVDYSYNISSILGCNLYLKLEMLQRCKAFKFRGALSKISTLPKGTSIACASAGNHSQGCALAAKLCGIKCIVYMPETAPDAKVAATQGYGAEVRLFGKNFDEAKQKCLDDLEKDKNLVYVPPFDDLYVMAGQGTIGLEIIQDLILKNINTVVVPVGGGGLCAGVCVAIKTLLPHCRIIAVNAALYPNTYLKYQKDKGREIDPLVETESKSGKKPLADGIAVTCPGTMTYPYVLKYVDEFVVVSESEISCAISVLAQRAKCIVEGAGASTLAAVLYKKFQYKKDENIVCILSGGNITLDRLAECFKESEDFLKKH